MRETGGHFAKRGEVFGARHLRAVQALDFLAALAELNDHLVEVAAEVIAEAKTHTGETLPQSE
jgi:hypothetical protein